MITPILNKLNAAGGTLYVFPSANIDLTRTLVSNDYEFKFSHFACLNLKNIKLERNESGTDAIYLGNLADYGSIVTEPGVRLVEHLQNYVMNFESCILSGKGDNDDYDNDIMTTVSEKVFFNWLGKVGGIKFDDDRRTESYTNLSDRTVQYIGNIDVVNTVDVYGDAYDEIYLYVPSTVGSSTYVYFRPGNQTDNRNYLDKTYTIGGSEYICGRSESDVDFSELSIKAIFDDDTDNKYYGDAGHTIDFRDSSYSDGISSMNTGSSESFKFNTILIYYDLLVKQPDGMKKMTTNLYGVLFLTDVDADGNFRESYTKIKETSYTNGNSYAFKVDLKVSGNLGTNTIETGSIQTGSASAMILYNRAISKLDTCIDMFYEQKKDIDDLRKRVEYLESMFLGIDTLSSLRTQVSNLYDLYDNVMGVDTDSLQKLIEEVNQKVNSIFSGGDRKLQYDMDAIRGGEGIDVKKESNNILTISRTDGVYSINHMYSDKDMTFEITEFNPIEDSGDGDKVLSCYMEMIPGENITVLYIGDEPAEPVPVCIYISDTKNEWKAGQSLKIFFESVNDDDLDWNGFGEMTVYVDGIGKVTVSESEYGSMKMLEIIRLESGRYMKIIR